MKSLEDIIIDIAEWVKEHGPIKRNFTRRVIGMELPTYGPLALKNPEILHQLIKHKDEQGRATCIWPTEELIAEILEFGFETGLAQYVEKTMREPD